MQRRHQRGNRQRGRQHRARGWRAGLAAAAVLLVVGGCSNYATEAKYIPTASTAAPKVEDKKAGACGTFKAGDGVEFVKPCVDGKPSTTPKCSLGIDRADFPELATSTTQACVGFLVDGRRATAYVLGNDATFDTGRADIKAQAEQGLIDVTGSLRARFPSQPILVRGHTDAQGNEGSNQELSTRRAESVKGWLITKGRFPGERIETRGLANRFPVSPERRPDGSEDRDAMARNRRVEVLVIE